MGIGGLHTKSKLMVWWEASKYGPKTKKTSWLTRKLAGGEESGLQGEEQVFDPCTTFQTRKTRFVPKTNQNGCKTRDREAKHAAESLEN